MTLKKTEEGSAGKDREGRRYKRENIHMKNVPSAPVSRNIRRKGNLEILNGKEKTHIEMSRGGVTFCEAVHEDRLMEGFNIGNESKLCARIRRYLCTEECLSLTGIVLTGTMKRQYKRDCVWGGVPQAGNERAH